MPLHNSIPAWAIKTVTSKPCEQCSHSLLKSYIVAVGMRQVDNKILPFVEYKCQDCNHRAIRCITDKYEVQDLESLCNNMLDDIKRKRSIQKSVRERKNIQIPNTPITERETKGFARFLKNSKSHEDFMKKIGAFEYFKMLKNFDANR